MGKNTKLIKVLATIVSAMLLFAACGSVAEEASLPETGGEAEEAMTEEKEEQTTEAASEEDKDVEAEDKAKDGKSDSKQLSYPDKDYADKVDANLSSYEYTRNRTTSGLSGDTLDISVYKDRSGNIVKIVEEDYGSDGRITTAYYYADTTSVVYMTQSKTDIYGTGAGYTEADLSDPEADYTKWAIFNGGDLFIDARRGAYNGKALLYGYVGDEQGGVLENVKVSLRNLDGKFTLETTTDGDGYYTFEVPQKEDTYNLTYTYGDYMVSSLNDVHIVPGTPEYSLGRVYVAPNGHAVHDTDVYLLNPSIKSPEKLKDGEYLAVLDWDNSVGANLSLVLVNKDNPAREDVAYTTVKIDPSDSKTGYALYVEDITNIGRNDLASTIGTLYGRVTIYDKNGIVAAYIVPAGRLGTLWEVCDIAPDGDLSISGIMYVDSKGWK